MATYQINAKPHAGQRSVHNDPARFKVLACGRRWGKTRLGVHECLDQASQGKRAWWVSPSYKTSEVGWRPLRDYGAKIGAEIRKVDRQINLSSGGSVTVRSADNPDSLRGEGLDFVVMDECAFINEAAWTEALRPALSDRQGGAMFISTPAGHNWFYRIYQRGLDPHQAEWAAWHFPTSDNPFIVTTEIEAARDMLPERIYQQEYMAMFIDDAGGIFRGVMDCAVMTPLDAPVEGRQYAAGVDVASMVDFTVAAIFDVGSKEMVYMDRFNRIDYNMLEDRLAALYRRFKLQSMTIEDNSIGLPVFDHLKARGLNVIPFHTSNTSKHTIISNLAAAFEHREIKILNDPILIGELQAFEGKRTDGGFYRYSAPTGLHDDCVMATAIAWQGVSLPPPAGEIIDDIDMSVYKSKRRKSVWE